MYGITEVVKSEGIANGYEVVRSLEKGLLKGKVMDPSSLHPLEVKLLTLSFKSASDGRKVYVTELNSEDKATKMVLEFPLSLGLDLIESHPQIIETKCFLFGKGKIPTR